jgi:hypothetical protein
VRALPLERILASKRAAGRAKDLATIPALEDALAARRARETEPARAVDVPGRDDPDPSDGG